MLLSNVIHSLTQCGHTIETLTSILYEAAIIVDTKCTFNLQSLSNIIQQMKKDKHEKKTQNTISKKSK